MAAILQMFEYNIKHKSEVSISGGIEQMSELEYTPEFITEMTEIIDGEHIRIPDNMSLFEYISSLPDDEDDE